jgi:hypothetical protein
LAADSNYIRRFRRRAHIPPFSPRRSSLRLSRAKPSSHRCRSCHDSTTLHNRRPNFRMRSRSRRCFAHRQKRRYSRPRFHRYRKQIGPSCCCRRSNSPTDRRHHIRRRIRSPIVRNSLHHNHPTNIRPTCAKARHRKRLHQTLDRRHPTAPSTRHPTTVLPRIRHHSARR